MLGIILSALHMVTHLLLLMTPWGRDYHYLLKGETEAQGKKFNHLSEVSQPASGATWICSRESLVRTVTEKS